MAVLASTVLTPSSKHAGRVREVVTTATEMLRRRGANAMAVLQVRGGRPNDLAVLLELPDWPSYGRFLDELYASDDFSGLQEEMSELKVSWERSADYFDLPGFELDWDATPKGCLGVTFLRTLPGKLQVSVERMARAKTLYEKHGGSVRALRSMHSEPWGVNAFCVFAPSFAAYGSLVQKLGEDQEFQTYQAEVTGEPTSEWLRTSLYRVIA